MHPRKKLHAETDLSHPLTDPIQSPQKQGYHIFIHIVSHTTSCPAVQTLGEGNSGNSGREAACFGEDSFTGWFRKRKDHFLIFERVEKGHVVLIVDDDNGVNGP